MIDQLSNLFPFTQDTLTIGFLVFLRVGAAMAAIPGFGEQMIPLRVRLAVTFAFCFIVMPLVSDEISVRLDQPIVQLGLVEIAAGLIFGVFLRYFVHALQIAGSMAAQSVSLSQLLGATSADPVPALGQVLVLGGIALALALGFHIRLAEYLVTSYDIIPPGLKPDAGFFAERGVKHVAATFGLAFSLAAPFVIASAIYNVALGVINRAMPQLMVAFVGAPAITAGGLILLAMSAPMILQVWSGALFGFMNNPMGGL